MTGLKEQQIFDSFGNKEYRDAFVAEHLNSGLAFQIRALREKNGWTQDELARLTGKAQETISQLENPDYGRFTLKTLKALASAFDLALMVNLVSFSELIARVSNLSPETIAPPSYDNERQMSFADVPGNSTWATIWNYTTEHDRNNVPSVVAGGIFGTGESLMVNSPPEPTRSTQQDVKHEGVREFAIAA